MMPSTDGSTSKHHYQRRPWKGSFPYETDYNDHFETPDVAYQDVAVFLDWINSAKAKGSTNTTTTTNGGNRSDLILYDPYYCQGRTARLFRDLGFTSIIHEKRDFYHDIESNQVPSHDVLIPTPPYSDQHKKQCLDFCWEQLLKHNRPFCLLLPAYVAARQYYRQLLQDNDDAENKVIYLIPNQHYQYDHPEGTGKAESPFDSLWFCGLPSERSTRLQEFIDLAAKAGKFRVAQSLSELEELKLISTQTRPNPRQRRKKRKAALGDTGPGERIETKSRLREVSAKNAAVAIDTSKPSNKKSKYRDQGGKRIKGRF
jgi:hypothetical protein